jgi:DNA polymerase-3 subunit delta'
MWQVFGQDHILGQLEDSLRQGRPAHAYLLVGPSHVGKMTLARNLAQSVNCLQGPGAPCGECDQCVRVARGHHADVRIVAVGRAEPEGPARTVIGIGDVKEVLRQVNLKPFEGACSVVIFDTADLMSEEAANALLKTLEEPPPQVLILLLTANEEAVLPTIRSRCRRLMLLPLPKDAMADRLLKDHQASPEEAERLSRLSRGCLGWAITALEGGDGLLKQREEELDRLSEACRSGLAARFGYANELAALFSKDRDAARQSLYLWLRWWRDLLLLKEGGEEYVHNTDRQTELLLQASRLSTAQIVRFVKRLLETLEALDRNASARLALEVLMLDLPTMAATT